MHSRKGCISEGIIPPVHTHKETMTLTDKELGVVTDEVYASINDAHEHDLMHIVYIYLDYFNEYGAHYE